MRTTAQQGAEGSLDSLSVRDYILWMKQFVGYFGAHKALGIMILAGFLLTGTGLWYLVIDPGLIGGPEGPEPIPAFLPNAEPAKSSGGQPATVDYKGYVATLTAIAATDPLNLGDTDYGLAPGLEPNIPTDTPSPSLLGITVIGQYCQDGDPYVNFKFDTVMGTTIDASGLGDEGFPRHMQKLIVSYLSPDGNGVYVIETPEGNDPSLDMTCALVKSDLYGALLNCTGPENSTIPILVAGTPVDVSFSSCGANEPKPAEECPRRDCR